jgi:DNA modification methylase
MYQIDEIKNTILQGDALSVLKNFPSDSIDCFFTSSPYYGLRKYDTPPIIFGGNKDCNHQWNEFVRKGISGGTKSKKVQIKEKDNFQIVSDSNQSSCILCGAWRGELGQEPVYTMFIQCL